MEPGVHKEREGKKAYLGRKGGQIVKHYAEFPTGGGGIDRVSTGQNSYSAVFGTNAGGVGTIGTEEVNLKKGGSDQFEDGGGKEGHRRSVR